MVRRISGLLAFLLIFAICGCTRVVSGNADELVMNVWYFKNDYGVYSVLSFIGDRAELIICGDGKNTEVISGQVMVNENEIAITDDETQQNFVMSYVLYGDRIVLTYDGLELTMKKYIEASGTSPQRIISD